MDAGVAPTRCASRYLALRVLPAAMRDSVSLVYLLARVTNIIAATSLISAGERFDLLLALRTQLDRGVDDRGLKRIASEVARLSTPPEEKQLLASLKPALAVLARFDAPDRKAITVCLARFIEGAELDLLTFPGEQSGSVVALRELVDLERYTYLVAGNVGEFWTKLAYAHAPRALPGARDTMLRYGVRFGTALQLTKLLRECAKNLRAGRCYLPHALLERAGLNPQDLLRPDASARARPVLNELARSALAHYRCGLNYTLAIDCTSIRLRLACMWPMMIGLKTLLLLVENEAWLAPGHEAKVRRRDIALVTALSLVAAPSNELVLRWAERTITRIEARLARG
jgi:farnesyl-diphosphate farnesyltransferase